MIPLLGFTPDIDSSTPGAVVDCENMLPYLNGLHSMASAVDAGYASLGGACRGAGRVVKLDSTSRTFAATDTYIYELSSGTWTDVSRAGNYSIGSEGVWRFAQFGEVSLAANKSAKIQRSTTGDFADISSAPQAALIESNGLHVMACNVNDVTYGDRPDGWWCCALGNETDWAPSETTQSNTGRLLDTPGEIIGLRALGPHFVAYKSRSIYLATYAGPPDVFNWQLVIGKAGCVSNESIVSTPTAHFFIGDEDIYQFDGSRPSPIATGVVREWFYADLARSYAYKIQGVHDRNNGIVLWFYPSASGGGSQLDSWIAFNYKNQKWGRGRLIIQSVVETYSGGYTYDTMPLETYDDVTQGLYDIPSDSLFWVSGQPTLSFFGVDNKLKNLSGVSDVSSITLHDVGDDYVDSFFSRARLRYKIKPVSASMLHSYRENIGDDLTLATDLAQEDNGAFNWMWSARWHRCSFYFTGDVEVIGWQPQISQEGER